MKKFIYPLAAGLIVLAAACKKETQQTPVNTPTLPENCSFCYADFLAVENPGSFQSTVDSTDFVYQESFIKYDGSPDTISFMEKSILGIYGFEGLSLVINNDNLPLVCSPNKITFAHARSAGNTNANPGLMNVKLPGTPLIVTVPDSLNFYLSPYGYSVQHFFQPGIVYRAGGDVVNPNGVVDSVIITGPVMNTATIGANIFESELRSICISHQ